MYMNDIQNKKKYTRTKYSLAFGVPGKYSSGENVNIAPMEASFCALVLNSRVSKSSLTVVKINVATDSEGKAQSPLFTVKFVPSNSIVSFPLVKVNFTSVLTSIQVLLLSYWY